MSCQYELVVVDLDGTLLNCKGQASERNCAAIGAARDAGVEVIIATGRAYIESRAILGQIACDGPVIVAGGAMLCDGATGRTLDRHAMPFALVEKISESLNRHGHMAQILKDATATSYDYLIVGAGELDPASQWWFETMPVRVLFTDDLKHDLHPEDSVRVGTVARGDALKTIADELRDDLGDTVFLQHWSAVTATEATGSTTHLLEAFNPQVNKWTMVERYCRRRGVDPARVAAIGDGLNDVCMLRGAGLGIAMGNADAGVMHVCQRVTENHDCDGVAHAIEQLLCGAW
jgi:hydroxymethylpyrimidine pyrophosphatase-like HAD family hydrolase